MHARVRKFAHVLERFGLAMAGAASGLFVAIHVGSSVSALTSQAFLLIMMLGGAIGFYVGIDTPPKLFHPKGSASTRKIDAAELLSAIGTFLATLVAFFSVGVVVLRTEPDISWTAAIMLGWVLGVAMQVVAGTIARMRA
ncbi:hypothetical protein H8A99_36165 [Bradyrhizobium sp. Arg68]|uniref:hypothetical protein n=1 Tax=Bradyrhizobium ivorense TaxID=2511166 RepID=UPI001E485E73|nr:hypothetical protein [Bradyrhizobium ivorense]MCC8941719.1 hypothetical protein [Bradyrhizobium ivorense]